MSEPLDLEELANIRERLNRPTTLQKTVFRIIAEADIAKLLAEVDRLRAALHGSEAGPQEAREETMNLSLHRCKVCGTAWLLWPDAVHGGGWNLLDKYQRPGSCCDNVAMGEQIEHLRDIPLAGSEAGVSARVLELAEKQAKASHLSCMASLYARDRHDDHDFNCCTHPDCAAVRAALGVSPAAPEKE